MFIPEWLLALALTLFIVDIFVATEVLTWTAFAAIATYVTWRLDPSPLWAILTFITVFSGTVFAFYRLGGRAFIGKLLDCTVLRNASKTTLENVVGQTGIVCWRNNQAFLKWNGELWPIDTSSAVSLPEGESVQVVKFHDGIASVEKASKEERQAEK